MTSFEHQTKDQASQVAKDISAAGREEQYSVARDIFNQWDQEVLTTEQANDTTQAAERLKFIIGQHLNETLIGTKKDNEAKAYLSEFFEAVRDVIRLNNLPSDLAEAAEHAMDELGASITFENDKEEDSERIAA